MRFLNQVRAKQKINMNLKQVTLIRCESKNINVYSSFSHPGLALPIIGTILKNLGYNITIYIDSIKPPSWDVLRKSDLIGFSVNSSCFLETYKLARRIKEEIGCPIIFGGPHVTFNPEEALQFGDFVVRGEGEKTIIDLCRALEDGKSSFEHIRGLSWRAPDGRIHHNADRPLESNLDLVPDQSLIAGFKKYNRRLVRNIFHLGMLVSTSRGCVHKCTFCIIPQLFGRKIRHRHLDAVVADIRKQIEFAGHKFIYFTDDNFAANFRRTKELLQRITKERLNIRFSAQVRCDIGLDQELMDLMAAAGCHMVFVGFESINDKTLKAYNKGQQTLSLIERSIVELHKRKIIIHGMFVIGADSDGPGTAIQTAQWAADQGIGSLQMLPLCPLPGTEIFTQLEKQNRIFKTSDPILGKYIPYGAGNFVLFKPKNISAVDLQQELLSAYRIFYNYRQILKRARHIFRKGLRPLGFNFIGSQLIKRSKQEIRHHIEWLRTVSTD
jgi:anaerobic magnesium-protoporphyrin IX monomethyl ester cyclase